jgi:hypothetical protein
MNKILDLPKIVIGNDSDFGLDIPNVYQPNNYL